MTGRYLLDTRVVVEVFGGDPTVEARLEAVNCLYGSADQALMASKRAGRNRVTVWPLGE